MAVSFLFFFCICFQNGYKILPINIWYYFLYFVRAKSFRRVEEWVDDLFLLRGEMSTFCLVEPWVRCQLFFNLKKWFHSVSLVTSFGPRELALLLPALQDQFSAQHVLCRITTATILNCRRNLSRLLPSTQVNEKFGIQLNWARATLPSSNKPDTSDRWLVEWNLSCDLSRSTTC